jgi:hypothetical protein
MDKQARIKNDKYNEYADIILEADFEFHKYGYSAEYYKLLAKAEEKYKEWEKL